MVVTAAGGYFGGVLLFSDRSYRFLLLPAGR